MPMPPAMKNSMLPNNASMSLGMGDQLQSQVEDELAQRKKKLLKAGAAPTMGPATQSLFAMGNPGG